MAILVSPQRGGIGSSRHGGLVEIDQVRTLKELDQFIEANEKIISRMPAVDNVLAQFMSRTADAFVHKWSGGPIRTPGMGSQAGGWKTPHRDSAGRFTQRQTNIPWSYKASKAWSFPVPRITGKYYAGWKVKKIANGVWMNYNDSREAYFIEYGIHPTSTHRVRRPVAKKSAIDTLRWTWNSKVIGRFADSALSSLKRQGTQSPKYQNLVFPE